MRGRGIDERSSYDENRKGTGQQKRDSRPEDLDVPEGR